MMEPSNMAPDTEMLLTRWLADGAKLSAYLHELPPSERKTVREMLAIMTRLLDQSEQS